MNPLAYCASCDRPTLRTCPRCGVQTCRRCANGHLTADRKACFAPSGAAPWQHPENAGKYAQALREVQKRLLLVRAPELRDLIGEVNTIIDRALR